MPPALAYGFDPFHYAGVGEELSGPVTERGLQESRLVDVAWLTVFPPAFVEAVGEHVPRTASVWRRERFDDGALALVAVPDPTDPNDVDLDSLREHVRVDQAGPGL